MVCCLEKSGCYSESVVVCINPHCTHRIMIEVTRRGKVQCWFPENILCTMSVLFVEFRFCFQLPIVDQYRWFTQRSHSMMIAMIIDPYQRTDNWEYLCVPLVCNMLCGFLFWYVATNSFSDSNVKPPLFLSSPIFSAGGNAGRARRALDPPSPDDHRGCLHRTRTRLTRGKNVEVADAWPMHVADACAWCNTSRVGR